MLFRAALLAAALPLMGQAALADAYPRLKPPVQNHSSVLGSQDFHNFRHALRRADHNDWDAVRSTRHAIGDETARKVLLWRVATGDNRVGYDELRHAADELVGWPRHAAILRDLEHKMEDARLSPSEIIQWFERHEPVTGDGRLTYGEALIALGRQDEGAEQVRRAWREQTIRQSRQSDALRRHRSILTSADHAARVDFLLWSNQRTAASALLPELEGGERQVATARIRLAGREAGVDGAVNAVPSSLSTHPGLIHDRARWRRQGGNNPGALELLLELPDAHQNTAALEAMWTERKLIILDLMRSRDYTTAYQLAASNGMSAGASFADAEFMAGWLALSFLDRPDAALEHFQNLEAGVSMPVSLSRARYWQGRAADAAGDPLLARDRYEAAAQHPTTYYAQLAILALGPDAATLQLPPDPIITEENRAAFHAREDIRALVLLGEMSQDYLFRAFAAHLESRMSSMGEQAMLADIALDFLRLRDSVRMAKSARHLGQELAERAYPLIDVPEDAPVRTETALTLSVIRQETEFDARAVSHAGARGIMQMMPATAQATARQTGLPYNEAWLTDDPNYNMRLGMAHLDEVVGDYGGSLVLALAAYNAGGARVRRWVADYGDPRTGQIDPIDWVESLPFYETRNYVQRVLENIQVYRARQAGGASPLNIERDMVGAAAAVHAALPSLSPEALAAIEAADAATRDELGMDPDGGAE